MTHLKNQILKHKMSMRKQLPNKTKTEKYKAHKLFKKSQIVTKKVKVQKKDPKVGRPAKQRKGAKDFERKIVKEIVRKTPVKEKVTKVSKKRKGGISKANGERKKLHEDPYAAKLHQLEQVQLFSKRIIDKEALATTTGQFSL